MKYSKLLIHHLCILVSVFLCGSHASAQALNRPPTDRGVLPLACFKPDSIVCSYSFVRQIFHGRPTRDICIVEGCDCYSPQGLLTDVGGRAKVWCYRELDIKGEDGRRVYPPLPDPIPFGIFPDGLVPPDDTYFAGTTKTEAIQSESGGNADAAS